MFAVCEMALDGLEVLRGRGDRERKIRGLPMLGEQELVQRRSRRRGEQRLDLRLELLAVQITTRVALP
jgi:hypothetical protein